MRYFRMDVGSRWFRYLLLLLLLSLPIACTYIILYRQFQPIPLLDDYPSILGFAEVFQHQPSVKQKLLYILTAQNNEYKLILMHAVVGFQLATIHRVSLTSFVVVGNLAPLCILAVLWCNSFRQESDTARRMFLFLPVPFLLFQLNYAEAFNWAMGTPQVLIVIACSFLALHLLLRGTRAALLWAALAGALACGASAGGFLLAPIGWLLLFPRRRYRAVLVWTTAFLLMLLAYADGYVRVPGTSPNSLSALPLFFFSLAGGAYENMHHRPVPYLSVALGVALTFGLSLLFRRHPESRNRFLYSAALFLFGSVALASFGRYGMGLNQSLSGRYKIYSDLLLIVAYIVATERLLGENTSAKRNSYLPYRSVFCALAVVVLLYAGSGVVGYRFLEKRQARLIEGMRQYEASPMQATPMLDPNESQRPASKAHRIKLVNSSPDLFRTASTTRQPCPDLSLPP